MANISDYLENELIKHIFRTGSFTKPTNLYYALFTAAPSDAGGGTEVSGGAYARVAVSVADASFDATSGTDGATANTGAITFPAPSGANWGTVTHMGVFDAATTGNLLMHGALTTSRLISDGDAAPVYSAGAFTFTLA